MEGKLTNYFVVRAIVGLLLYKLSDLFFCCGHICYSILAHKKKHRRYPGHSRARRGRAFGVVEGGDGGGGVFAAKSRDQNHGADDHRGGD